MWANEAQQPTTAAELRESAEKPLVESTAVGSMTNGYNAAQPPTAWTRARFRLPMSNYPHPIIAKEGWPFVAASLIVSALVTYYLGWWSLPFWLISVFILQFFRDPPRAVPDNPAAVVSPADGRVLVVEKTIDPYLAREAIKVSVFMNVFNVHSNRAPVDGRVSGVWYHPGKFVNAALPKASTDNERNALWLRTADGTDITAVQVAGLIARRILCYVGNGDTVRRGQRYGFIRFGSRVDVYLPLDATVRATIGDKVYATESVLAELPSASVKQ
jgi:phosphatidylserine decarboxylase